VIGGDAVPSVSSLIELLSGPFLAGGSEVRLPADRHLFLFAPSLPVRFLFFEGGGSAYRSGCGFCCSLWSAEFLLSGSSMSSAPRVGDRVFSSPPASGIPLSVAETFWLLAFPPAG